MRPNSGSPVFGDFERPSARPDLWNGKMYFKKHTHTGKITLDTYIFLKQSLTYTYTSTYSYMLRYTHMTVYFWWQCPGLKASCPLMDLWNCPFCPWWNEKLTFFVGEDSIPEKFPKCMKLNRPANSQRLTTKDVLLNHFIKLSFCGT